MQRQYSQLCHLESGLNSEHHLVLSTVNLQSPGLVCSHFLKDSSYDHGYLCHLYSLVITLFPFFSSTQWGFSIYKTAHRTWLRISVALGRGTKSS